MRLSYLLTAVVCFVFAAGLSLVTASFAVTGIERSSETAVRRVLDETGHDWAEVAADGLQVTLSGIAPDEARRFTAISVTGSVVDAARIIDEMQITPSSGLAAPEFSAEILRNDAGITVIGLIPTASNRDQLSRDLAEIAGGSSFANLIENASYPVPRGWEDAIGFAVVALRDLPRAKISVVAGQVSITAITNSAEEKKDLTTKLTRTAPPGLRLALDIAAPRPVITPFTLRYVLDDTGGQFDACSAESKVSRDRIIQAAKQAKLTGPETCVIGMGVPSPKWANAAETSLEALAELGGGSVTISNADVTLIATPTVDEAMFERVVGDLEAALPQVFALHAVRPVPAEDADDTIPEFSATLSPEGLVQLRGRISDPQLRRMVDSYAKARFGSDNVYTATRIVPDLPSNWPVRVLAGLEALSHLGNGFVSVTPDQLTLRGVSHLEDTKGEVSRLLSDKLGDAQTFTLNITYRAPPEPEDKVPEPEECEQLIAAVQASNKIAFEPGSATVAGASAGTMDQIAEILLICGPVRMEIQGHTDSQGRESMNQQLSQSRAQSVLNELRARRVRTASLAAVGYGESRPIASNDTEDGREANRRIEFWLIRPDSTAAEQQTTLDATAAETPMTTTLTDETAPPEEAEQETSNGQN
ncbi:OmpA family protein [Rhodobacteraceae bacterium M382]|nr:OmpA family protein [Rhodobacteraceae bacterium M382]